jgi:hypothetical protein
MRVFKIGWDGGSPACRIPFPAVSSQSLYGRLRGFAIHYFSQFQGRSMWIRHSVATDHKQRPGGAGAESQVAARSAINLLKAQLMRLLAKKLLEQLPVQRNKTSPPAFAVCCCVAPRRSRHRNRPEGHRGRRVRSRDQGRRAVSPTRSTGPVTLATDG